MRGRGRPRSGTTDDTRQQIIDAARQLFAENGFDGASMRSVAASAGVDPSLIRHYFGDKSGLLVATMQLPINPLELIRPVLARGPEGLGHRIVSTFLSAWDVHGDVLSGLIRTSIASADRSGPMLAILHNVVLPELTAVLGGPNRELRATLVMSELLGIATVRYVLQIQPVASAPAEVVAGYYAPALQALITPA
jgi:AcrR family transcriptional regulator